MNITVTGAWNRLGRALATALSDDHAVRLVDLPNQPHQPGSALGALLDGDIRDPDFARHAVGRSGALVHLAAHPIAWLTGESSMADEDVVEYAARGTYVTLVAAAAAGVPRVVLASTLDVMEAYPPGWLVDEAWRPRPGTAIEELAPYVAEVSARDLARSLPLSIVCLRLGRLVGDEAAQRGPADPRWLHLDDAVQAIRRALTYPLPEHRAPGPENWRVFHIPGGRQARFPLAAAAQPAFGYAPEHDFGGRPALPETRTATMDEHGSLVPAHPVRGRRSERVTVYGACGPLGSAARPWLEDSYALRLTDVLPPEEAAERVASRFPNAPVPAPAAPPHEFRRVDVGNWGEVSAAAEGAAGLVNCSVLRERLDAAFRVNTIGAYNVVRAAVAHSIKRVIHTGPQTLNLEHPAGYGTDFDLPADVPIRAGANIYFHSKLLGLEICRTFAENHGLEVAALLVSSFVDPQRARRRPDGSAIIPSTVAWSDAGLAIRCALDVPALPAPFEALRIVGDLPHGKYSNTAARRALGWAPRESLAHLWQAPHPPTTG